MHDILMESHVTQQLSSDPRLANLELPSPNFPPDLWKLLCTREAAAAAEAATDAELPAAAGLSGLLVRHMPQHVADPQFRMAVGYGLRRILERLGCRLEREDVQITVPGIFSTGAVYVREGFKLRDRSARLKRADRDQWAKDRIAKQKA